MKSKNFIIDLVIYPLDVIVSIGESDKKLFRTLVENGVSLEEVDLASYEYLGVARYCLFGSGQSLIRLQHKPKSPSDYGLLQHEIFHCATRVLWRIGMKLKIKTSDEAYAYLIQYITKEIYKKLK